MSMRAIHINKTPKAETVRPGDGIHHESGAIIFRTRTGWEIRGFQVRTLDAALALI